MQKPRQPAVLIDMDPLEPGLLGRILDRAAGRLREGKATL